MLLLRVQLLKNASTEKFPKKIENGSNTQKSSGGAVTISHSVLNLENVIFQENHSKAVTPNPEKAGDPAIESMVEQFFLIILQ